jgi:hypothetical protein
MTANNFIAASIGDLIQINYERMAAFDKASKLSTDEDLKNYFEARADESEQHIEALQELVPGSPEAGSGKKSFLPSCKLFDKALYLKNIPVLLDSARSVEKHMVEWYQKMIEGMSHLPADLVLLLQGQLESVKNGHTQLKNLRTAFN